MNQQTSTLGQKGMGCRWIANFGRSFHLGELSKICWQGTKLKDN